MILRVWITWVFLAGIVAYEVYVSFARYNIDKKLWKLIAHSVLLFMFCIMNLQLGFFCLNMQFDKPRNTSPAFDVVISKLHVTPSHKPAVSGVAQGTKKK